MNRICDDEDGACGGGGGGEGGREWAGRGNTMTALWMGLMSKKYNDEDDDNDDSDGGDSSDNDHDDYEDNNDDEPVMIWYWSWTTTTMMMILEHSMGKDDGQSHIQITHNDAIEWYHIPHQNTQTRSHFQTTTLTDRRKEFIEL